MNTFAEAAHAFADLVRRIRPDQWAAPGLGEWDLRALVGHTSRSLITVDTYLDQPAETEQITSPYAYYAGIARSATDPAAITARARQAGEALGPDPANFVDALVRRVLPRVQREEDPLIATIGGGMRLSQYLPTRSFELVVHGYDIARAAGLQPPDYGESLLIEVAQIAADAAVLSGHAETVILALTGREQLPAGFSIV